MSSGSRTPSLTPSPSPPPVFPVQPDHFYSLDSARLPPSPDSEGRGWLDPAIDPLAHRGIPVFKPTMDEFEDFEKYVTRIECWGMRSGIVKVIPPKEWTDALPPLKHQLSSVKIRTPIEQHMLGRGGLFRQENIERRRIMSVREWAELCAKDDYRAPGVEDVGPHARSVVKTASGPKKKVPTRRSETAEPSDAVRVVKPEDESVEIQGQVAPASPPDSVAEPHTHLDDVLDDTQTPSLEDKLNAKRKRQSRQAKEARLAERATLDTAFLETFDSHSHWLPPKTKASDYSSEFCQKLERQYWRNCGLGKPAWYGADTQGSLFTNEIKSWNVGHLPSTLSRLLPASFAGLPGVNTPYLYWGMWRATFAWHVEDMDLFSINFIHFGAPKFWYAVPQGRAFALEQTMRGYFPKDTSLCPQFLRHKSFLASPTLLAQSSCRPNVLVQQAGEFVITFPRGYHAGFNLGFNCAESVNFALDSWLDLGKKAQACQCISDSVRIDVSQLLVDREMERLNPSAADAILPADAVNGGSPNWKRKSVGSGDLPRAKRVKTKAATKSTEDTSSSSPKRTLTLKLGPKPIESEDFPCCLCPSTNREGLLRVHDPPLGKRDHVDDLSSKKVWLAHEDCASIVPETWVDEVEVGENGSKVKERVVFGVDAIVKDRWNLNCSACTKPRRRAHGAPIQCTKGKCSKAFHVSCARAGEGQGVVFSVLREVEKEVVLLDQTSDIVNCNQGSDATPASASESLPRPLTDLSDVTRACQPRVLKVIKKVEVQVLCNQHNPAVAAAKKASRQDKIRRELLALPSMGRIKIRVSAGVYEVSLIRVIEETGCVEVLWDRGIKREFKWGSVVFGNTDGQTVLQKPAQESEQVENPDPASTSSTVLAVTEGISSTGQQFQAGDITSTATYVPQQMWRDSGTWAYQSQAGTSQSSHVSCHPYAGYHRDAISVSLPVQQSNQAHLQWQRPYIGPRPELGLPHEPSSVNSISYDKPSDRASSKSGFGSDSKISACLQPLASTGSLYSLPDVNTPSSNAVSQPPTTALAGLNGLSSLSSLPPEQIAGILRNHPEIRDAVWAAIDRQRKADS